MAKRRAPAEAGEFVFRPEDSLGFLVRDTHRAFGKVLAAKISERGVTLGMWFFLRVLWEEDGLSQRELSRRIGMMEPTTVSAIATMERRGFVVRRPDKRDKRRRLVYLTRKGRALKQSLLPFAFEANVIATRTLDEAKLAELRRLLAEVKANLTAHLAWLGNDVETNSGKDGEAGRNVMRRGGKRRDGAKRHGR